MTLPDPLATIQQKAGSYLNQQTPTSNYSDPPPTVKDQVGAMPNSDKLTGIEKWTYERLPGFSQSTVGQALAKFNDSWAGKALSYLDVLAEGTERTVGLAVQLADPKGVPVNELQSAWYAGSLFGDTLNLPTFKYDNSGKIVGLHIPSDLPGAAGMAEARQQIAQRISQGQDAGEALVAVRDNYYNGLGALALRAQLYDTYFHVIADPLNYIMPALAPVEAIKARAIAAATGKISYSLNEISDFEKIARAAGNVAEAEDWVRIAEKVSTGELKSLDILDKAALFITGADELNPSPLRKFIAKTPILNMFELTPESKAKELITVLHDNINTRIIGSLYNDPDAENKIAQAITRAASSATGEEYGHAVLTLEGRTSQAYLKGADAVVTRKLQVYQEFAKERSVLQVLADTMQEDASKILKQAAEEPENLLRAISQKAQSVPVLGQLIQNGEISQDSLSTLSRILKDVPYNKDMFIADIMDGIAEHAMRQAVIQFGVKARGPFQRWMGAIKAAENLAFMRAGNFAYPIRNAINNEVTMLARGLSGLMTEGSITDFWKASGFIPQRLMEDLNLADIENFAKGSGAVLEEALKGGNYGAPEKIKNFVQNLNLGGVDTAAMGRRFEKSASMRAFTSGYMQYFDNYYKPTSITKSFSALELDEMRKIGDDIPDAIMQAVKSARGNESKLDEILKTNLNLSVQSVLDETSRVIGQKVEDVLDTDLVAHIQSGLPDAIKNNKVDQFVLETRAKIDTHLQDLFEKNLQNVVDDTAARVRLGGPKAFYDKFGDLQDMFWSAHTEHAIRTPEAAKLAREASSVQDYAKANALWEKQFADDAKFFDRAFGRYDATMKGLDEGAAALKAQGFDVPFLKESRQSFKEWRKTWSDFFDFRNTETRNFFTAKLKGQEYKRTWDALQSELDGMYKKAIDTEDRLMMQMDDAVGQQIADPAIRAVYTKARDMAAELRKADREAVVALRQQTRDLTSAERAPVFEKFWQERQARYSNMRQVDQAGIAAMQGDPNAAQMFGSVPSQKLTVDPKLDARYKELNTKLWDTNTPKAELDSIKKEMVVIDDKLRPAKTQSIYDIANEFGIPSASEAGTRNDRRILATVNKYTDGEKYTKVSDIPEEVARAAFEKRAAEKGLAVPSKSKPLPFVPDTRTILPEPLPIDLGLDLNAYGRQYSALDAIVDGAKSQAKKNPTVLDNLPEGMRNKVLGYIDQAKEEMASARHAAVRFGEFRRDSALLNYNRRTNFDSWVSNIFPYAFWTTGSVAKWAIHNIDRPAMFSTYLRTKKFLETAGTSQPGLPSRTQDQIRVKLPFAPSWMGDQFIDPLRLILPFDTFAQPLEQLQSSQLKIEGRATRVLDQMLVDGKITKREHDDAVASQSGNAWDMAVSQAQSNDDSLKFDTWDFASMISSPHAPIAWAYNLARGTPDEIGPFTPLSRTFRNVATVMGVKDWNNSQYNVEAKIRKQLGLPAFDKWDDYRIDRSLSNMAATGDYTPDEVMRAMTLSSLIASKKITREQAMQDPAWDVYQAGVERSNQEYAGGPGAVLLNLLGIPTKSYPIGEQKQRILQIEFGSAYDKYKKGNVDALTNFFDAHPEYETRLALFDKPEVRYKNFLIDSMWSKWNELPTLTKNEIKDQLGSTFNESFLSKDTRSYDNISSDQLQIWLKLMGADPPGTLSSTENALIELNQLKLTKPETAWRVQVFYDQRKQMFGNYNDMQNAYYALPKGSARSAYLAKNPQLKRYWDWRSDFMYKNPDLVPYLTDDENALKKAQGTQRDANVAVPTANEIKANLSPTAQSLIQVSQQDGDIPYELQQYLNLMADRYGITLEEMYGIVGLR